MTPATEKPAADIPRSGQGDMEANPRPVPRVRRMRDTDTATIAPARIAPQEAAGPARSRAASSRTSDAEVASFMMSPLVVRTHRQQQYDWQGNPEHPQQNSATHLIYSPAFCESVLQAWLETRSTSRPLRCKWMSENPDRAALQQRRAQ